MYKISFIQTDLKMGGAERRISTLANGLSKQGMDIEIVLFMKNEVAYSLSDGVKVISIDTISNPYLNTIEKIFYRIRDKAYRVCVILPLRIYAHLLRPLWKKPTQIYEKLVDRQNYIERAGRNIQSYVRHNPDRTLISFTSSTVFEVAPALCGIDHGPFIVSESADPSWDANPQFDEKRNWCYDQADVCVFQTPGAMAYFPKSIREKGVIIPNPVAEDLPLAFEGERDKVIVNFCRIDPVKNLELLIDAFASFYNNHKDYVLYIYGDEPDYLSHLKYKQSLLERIEKLNLSNVVKIYPFRKDIHQVIKGYSMYVSSSNHEGLSNAMLEAMALGLTVICTDCPSGGAAFAIKNCENGILVPVNDIAKMADAMSFVAEHPNEAATMSQNAMQIRETLSQNEICSKWYQLLKRYRG